MSDNEKAVWKDLTLWASAGIVLQAVLWGTINSIYVERP